MRKTKSEDKEEQYLECPECGRFTKSLFSSTYGPDGPHCFNCPGPPKKPAGEKKEYEMKPILFAGQPLDSKRYGLCAFVRWNDGDGWADHAVILLKGGIEKIVHWETLTVL